MGNLLPAGTKNPIIVMGVSGCGKTTVGRTLAERLDATFLDADDFHPETNVAKMRAGTPLSDADRAPWLATLNHALQTLSERGEQVVLACSALKKSYRDVIGARLPQAQWIFLDGSFELIAARMRERPNHYMPESLLRSQFDALERPDTAITISIELRPVEQVEAALYAVQNNLVP
jgi:carbohydrate kinase (thermoresistant glucokinase family)